MNTLFDEIYVAGTLKELQYRGIKVEILLLIPAWPPS